MLDWLRRVVVGGSVRQPWPAEVPRLFPATPDRALLSLAVPPARSWTVAMVCPLFEPRAPQTAIAGGAAFSRLLLRNLMLTPGLSVRGPEDTPMGHLRVTRMMARGPRQADVLVTGRARLTERPQVTAVLLWRGRAEQALSLSADSLPDLVLEASEQLAVALGGEPSPAVRAHWRAGLPASADLLYDYGAQLIAPRTDPSAALALWRGAPDFTLPLHLADQGDSDSPEILQAMMAGAVRDPHDAHLHYLVFRRLWRGQRQDPQPEALQFLRRALLAAPGHGRALLCAAATPTPEGADAVAFADLGYRLLPSDPAALSGHILSLRRQRHSPEQCFALAQQGIALSPYAPSSYERAIEALLDLGRPADALALARKLQALYEPRIHERTRRRLHQDPLTGPRLRQGWDPSAENRQRILALERRPSGLPSR